MIEETVMNSPERKKPTPEEKERLREKPPADEQSQATSEEFEEKGMGVAPKE